MEYEKAIAGLNNKIEILKEKIDSLYAINESLIFKLKESQSLSQIGSWEWNLSTNDIFWSDMMYSILGLSLLEQKPSYELALFHVHDEDKVEYERILGEALEGKTDYYLENRIRKKDNTTIFVISRGKCFFNKNGDLIRMIGTVQDITIQKQYLEANKKLKNYAYTTAHDLKAPLRAIINFSSLMRKSAEPKFNDTEKEYLSFIEQGGKELDGLIDNILNNSITNFDRIA